MTDGPPVEILPTLEPGDEVRLFFDRYHEAYPHKPDSPLETTVRDVDTRSLDADGADEAGVLTTVTLAVPASDEKAEEFRMEHRVERIDGERSERASFLLYRASILGTVESTGRVGHVDRVEVVQDQS